MERKLVISTGNQNKVKEIKDILSDLNIEVVSKKDLGLASIQVEEDGDTLEENSLKKARELSKRIDYMVVADDSGLFVDQLDGKPGVHSSRYGGEEGNDSKNNRKLLDELKGIPLEKREAKFKSIIALITEDKKEIIVYGECKGRIGFEEKGKNGFGYDPLFIPYGYEKTFGEIGEEEKNKISHRSNALKNLKLELARLLDGDSR